MDPSIYITPLIPLHQKKCFRDINFKFKKLESTDEVDSARAATSTSHEGWCEIKSGDVQKGLSSLLSSGRAQKEKLELKARNAFQEYYKQGKPRKSDPETGLMEICQI